VKVLYGRSSHHQVEAIFKAFARALRVACSKDRQLGRMLPRRKGLCTDRQLPLAGDRARSTTAPAT
jgi:hypothetical protein